MKTRIISGLVMVPLLVVLIFRGIPLATVTFLVGAIGAMELFRCFEKSNIKGNIYLAWGALVVLYVLHFVFPEEPEYISLWLVLSFVASALTLFPMGETKVEDAAATMFGIFYVEFLPFHMVLIDTQGQGVMAWLIVITAFVTDIAAYFTGYFLGKHKLCPNLSPKKTIEGAIGGVLGSLIVSVIFALIIKIPVWPHVVILAVFASVMAQLGDLTASAIKRRMGVKDYGNLIPGHGGILDRFDSIMFTAPTVYYYVMLVMN